LQIFAPLMMKENRAARVIALVLTLVCLVALFATTVLAQNTYVITDGENVTVHNSFASDPMKVLDEAGVELDPEDSYTTVSANGVSEITVQRAQQISIDYCGQKIDASSYGETVEAVLTRMGLQTDGVYSISHNLQTMTYDGMQISVRNIVETMETYTVEVPYETVYTNDPNLPEGQEKVLVAGSAGQTLCQANVAYLNNQEQCRTVVQQTVLQPPVDRIVAVGTGSGEAAQDGEQELYIGDGYIILPTGEVLTYTDSDSFVATAYTHLDAGCDMYTATGTRVKWGTVAVDPDMIPYGTRMFIVTSDGSFIYGLATAEDCGGAINDHRIDLYMPTLTEAFKFGRRTCTVYFLGETDW